MLLHISHYSRSIPGSETEHNYGGQFLRKFLKGAFKFDKTASFRIYNILQSTLRTLRNRKVFSKKYFHLLYIIYSVNAFLHKASKWLPDHFTTSNLNYPISTDSLEVSKLCNFITNRLLFFHYLLSVSYDTDLIENTGFNSSYVDVCVSVRVLA
jgi:hypothetical protein